VLSDDVGQPVIFGPIILAIARDLGRRQSAARRQRKVVRCPWPWSPARPAGSTRTCQRPRAEPRSRRSAGRAIE